MDISPGKGNSTASRGGRSSPMRKSQQQNQQSFQDSKDLLHGLTEKEIEIESLKTVIVGLDQKVKVTESVRIDLQISRDTLKDSEANRVLLQELLRQNSEKTNDEAGKNHKF